MITIYHNPRCSKSRQTLQLLESKTNDFEVIKYLEDIPSEKELSEIIKKLGITPIELVRKNEAIWKEKIKGKELSDKELISAMITHPKLIERPIVIKEKKAIIGRPPEKVLSLF
ncbi:arsenate reductase (glutaredoxin) [Patiriisocius hiemis]|uniref:Arsenate reductase (Glutaredoxin) n=1 Tax=Patiriisocius hiemis TaxID=3075604 RepID=A0ABU2YA75_9FLAO|nr:arsenate reductase (glutaredoxin) [Constantimarinum sp. W242]MDT0555094.1 arsenate reductase (glutaredoxin) [Constantimarinum sp. W242]